MKNRIATLILFVVMISSCRKDEALNSTNVPEQNITVDEAVAWIENQTDTYAILRKYTDQFKQAKSVASNSKNRIIIPIPGQPTYQNIKQGYRQLSITKNTETGNIEGKFLEIIPDAIYFQGKQRVDSKDFTGRIFIYDLKYNFDHGIVYQNGKKIGESRPATILDKQDFNPENFHFDGEQNIGGSGKIMMARVGEYCEWVTTTYIDAEGIYNIHGERFCTYYIYDDGFGGGGYNDSGINTDPGNSGGGGGGITSPSPPPPPPSNLPEEDKNNVDPKKMMECFGNISDPAAVYQVKVLVSEPMPGTTFNAGPNAFGHVAISLTKSSGGQMITQTIGYYPTGSGFDKLVSHSSMKDNSDLEYDVSATYYVTGENFQKMTGFISNPNPNYHYTDYNCATFAYGAMNAGGIKMLDPTMQIAVGGYAITPAGMGNALRNEQRETGAKNISSAGGRASASKGECK
ncbi:MAG: hypothetical protein EOO20_21765 [Chryseobacterium sp.]|nr:MAG: hypothetical protein EOO20_21765 [Chryseobacterium sp.]